MRWHRGLILWLILAGPVAGRGDTLVLLDGTRLEGELVSRDARRVFFRVQESDDEPGPVRQFPTASVLRVDRNDERIEELDAEPTTRPAALSPGQLRQILREAFELLEDKDRPAAMRALQKLVQRAEPETLATLEISCVREHGIGIAELLADLRLQEARRRAGDEPVQIRGATRYEAPALARLLEREYETLVNREVNGRSVKSWSREPQRYDKLTPTAHELVETARHAAALIGARLRFDHELRKQPQQRRALLDLRDDLARLAALVSALPGYTRPRRSTDEGTDPALQTLAQLRKQAEEAAASQPAGSQPASNRSANPNLDSSNEQIPVPPTETSP